MIEYQAESLQIPVELDDTSSPTTIYYNSNVVEKKNEEEETVYVYDVKQYDRQEWINIKLQSNVEYFALMQGVDL